MLSTLRPYKPSEPAKSVKASSVTDERTVLHDEKKCVRHRVRDSERAPRTYFEVCRRADVSPDTHDDTHVTHDTDTRILQ